MRFSKSLLIALALLAVYVIVGCQSVATTSAKLRNEEGNYEMAIELARQALADNPTDAEAYFQLGVSYSHLDSVGKAYQSFVKSYELDPKKKIDADNNIQHNFAKHYKLGQSAFKRNDFVGAATEFQYSADADPTQAVAYYNLAVAYSRMAEDDPSYYNQALAACDKVLELSNPSDVNYVKALQVAGRALAEMGQEEEAINRFQRLVEEDPTSYPVIEDLGNELLNNRQWKGAVVFLSLAADARSKIDADDFTLYYNIGAAYYNLREDDPNNINKAIANYEKALELQPDEKQTIFNIVVAYVAQQNWRQASEWGEKYISLNPSDPKGWQLLARCYSEMGEKDKAREAMARFTALRESQ